MALNKDQIEEITTLVRIGELSNRSIAKKAECSESAVRTLIKKNQIEKNAINALAREHLQNTIVQNETGKKINALKTQEKRSFDMEVINLSAELNIFNQDAIDNQHMVRSAQTEIMKMIEADPIAAVEQIPNAMALGRMSEVNRKQLFGVTQPAEVKTEEDQIVFNMNFGTGE